MSYLREMAEQGYTSDNIGPFHENMVPWLFTDNNVAKNGLVVDIGAGQGHGLIPLYKNGWENLLAVDQCDDNFTVFKEKYGFATFKCNIEKDKLNLKDESADAVMCFHLIEHLHQPDQFMAEIHRVLKPGGKFFVVTPDWRKQYKTFYRDPTHVRPYDKESIMRLFGIYSFTASVHSWGSAYGFGRLKTYIRYPKLGMIGQDILAIGTKK